MSGPTGEVTQLLLDWRNGDQAALDRLMPLVYGELRRIADGYMRRERPDHTLQTSALINEAYLRLANAEQIDWQDRAHFFGIAARLMRRVLVEHARAQQVQKRGGGAEQVALDEAMVVAEESASELLALDDALQKLAEMDPRRARVVELRYFGGLSGKEVAEVLGISVNTVDRDWNAAKIWLRRVMSEE